MLLNIYIYLYMYIYAIDVQIRRFCSNNKERGSALTECNIRAELCPCWGGTALFVLALAQ